MAFLPAGTALFTAAGKFVDRGPSPRLRRLRADAFFLVARFDVLRLALLLVRVAGFIALGHGCPGFGFDHFSVLEARWREAHQCPVPQPDQFHGPAPAQ